MILVSFLKRISKYYSSNEIRVISIDKKAQLLGTVLLLIAGIRIYYNIYNYMDIVFGDEVVYMKTGLNMFQTFNRDWGPMYCIWYKFLSLFIHDTVTLYYFNFAFIGILTSVLIYIAFICMDIHPVIAFYFGLCFICSKMTVPLWPRVSLFTISILMIGIIIISRIRWFYYRLLIFCLILLLASYARPELYLSFSISVFIFVFYFIRHKLYAHKKTVKTTVLFFIFFIVLHLIFQFPSNTYYGYPRSLAAFYQHYLINQMYLEKATDFDWIYWKDVHKNIFKGCHSLLDVVLFYPAKFFAHVFLNLKNYIIQVLINNLFVIFPFFRGMNKFFLGGSFFIILSSFGLILNKRIRLQFILSLKEHLFYLIMLFVWGLPTIISSIIIYPREHYVMLNYFLFIIPLCLLFSIFFKQYIKKKTLQFIVLLAIICIPFLSSCKDYYFFLTDHNENKMCARKALLYIKNRKLDPNRNYIFFADIHYFVGFLPDNFKEINTIFDKTKDVPFSTVLQQTPPDFILVNNCFNYSPSLINDPSWKEFIKNPSVYNYRYEFIKDCPFYFLVKKTIPK